MALQWDPLFRAARDSTFFLLGVWIFVHEVAITDGERPAIIAAALGLLGLAPMIRRDERKRDGG